MEIIKNEYGLIDCVETRQKSEFSTRKLPAKLRGVYSDLNAYRRTLEREYSSFTDSPEFTNARAKYNGRCEDFLETLELAYHTYDAKQKTAEAEAIAQEEAERQEAIQRDVDESVEELSNPNDITKEKLDEVFNEAKEVLEEEEEEEPVETPVEEPVQTQANSPAPRPTAPPQVPPQAPPSNPNPKPKPVVNILDGLTDFEKKLYGFLEKGKHQVTKGQLLEVGIAEKDLPYRSTNDRNIRLYRHKFATHFEIKPSRQVFDYLKQAS